MHWSWLLAQPSRGNVVRYEYWMLWHYKVLLAGKLLS